MDKDYMNKFLFPTIHSRIDSRIHICILKSFMDECKCQYLGSHNSNNQVKTP